MFRKTFVVGFVFITTIGILIEGRFLGYNTKYIVNEHKEGNDEPLLFFGFEDKTHCVSCNFVHGNTQTKLVKIKKEPYIGLVLDIGKEFQKTTHKLTKNQDLCF